MELRRRRSWIPAASTAAVCGLFVFLAAAEAAEPPAGNLSDPDAHVAWTGRAFQDEGTVATAPEACVAGTCDEFVLSVDLPDGVWDDPGGIQVSIRWPSEDNDLDLYVIAPDGTRFESNRLISTAEAVRIPSASDGDYRVLVAASLVEGEMGYEGFVEVEREPAAEPVRPLLPNLVALPPRAPHLATGLYLVDPGIPGELSSCYPEERIEQGAEKCLRFDQRVGNFGEGPLELRYDMSGVATDPQLRQRIYWSDGTFTDRLADTYELHPAHGHFHYRNFAESRLWTSNAAGERLGSEPVRTTRKNGFCLIDVEYERFGPGHKGDGPRTYTAPGCLYPTETEGDTAWMVHGITPGWVDLYNWYLADQYVEVSGLPDGYYLLETVADPSPGTLEESDEGDNAAAVLVLLEGSSATFFDLPPP